MSDSAIGPREKRRRETIRQIVELARARTAREGLSGYTVEELCEAVGISRRTFFNYFASKEDAVLGILVAPGEEELEAAFVAGERPHAAGEASAVRREGGGEAVSPVHADRPGPGGLGAGLFDDFLELQLARWRLAAPLVTNLDSLRAAVEREPRLHTRILERIRSNEQRDTALIERREGLEPGDARADTLVHLVGGLSHAVAAEYFRRTDLVELDPDDLAERFAERAALARALLAAP
ncbi:TetR/AcrR family transcriptional regulator [Brevibacterium sp.]|uniref:TetR/AcrR family transcriptional regulator n=1 Tax=Brevibacterium sp. TaxID=1701 RepID=UPI0025BB021C|nr:TetR/AcrR family transcriptional regulator [Brevibacterium sp.]